MTLSFMFNNHDYANPASKKPLAVTSGVRLALLSRTHASTRALSTVTVSVFVAGHVLTTFISLSA